jgi:hypothetical protein
MNKKSSISLFLAATGALAISATNNSSLKAGENDLGGLKEWLILYLMKKLKD